jgi:Domain of unknown function (DUF4252)
MRVPDMSRSRTSLLALATLALLLAEVGRAATPAPLNLPSFDGLARSARQSVVITLDSNLLGLAAAFLDPSRPEDAAARDLITGIRGIYVRSYSFDADFAYPTADVAALRKQLSAPGWQHLVGVRSTKDSANVDVYLSVDHDRANGLAVIASEPRQFTIVNIVGSIDLQKLQRLEGKFGVPQLGLHAGNAPPSK